MHKKLFVISVKVFDLNRFKATLSNTLSNIDPVITSLRCSTRQRYNFANKIEILVLAVGVYLRKHSVVIQWILLLITAVID